MNPTCRIQNPDTSRAGRVGATHGGAAGRRGGAGLGRTRRRWVDPTWKQPSLLLSSESRTLSRTSLRKQEQSNSYLTCRVQSPDIRTTGGSGRGGGAGPEWTSTVRFAQETSVPRAHQSAEDNCSERLFGSTNSLIRT